MFPQSRFSGHPARVSLIFLSLTFFASLAFQIGSLRQPLTNLLLTPAGVMAYGRYWQVVTHIFIIPDMLSLFFELLFFWFVAVPLELEMGSRRFLTLFTASILGSAAAVLIMPFIGLPQIIYFGPGAMLLLAVWLFSRQNPDQQFLMAFIVPVKAKYFLLFYIGLRLILSLERPLYYYLLLAELAGCGAALAVHWLLQRQQQRRDTRHRRPVVSAAAEAASREDTVTELNRRLLDRSRQTGTLTRPEPPPFTVCPEAEFSEEDRHCLKCSGYGYCLARKNKPRS